MRNERLIGTLSLIVALGSSVSAQTMNQNTVQVPLQQQNQAQSEPSAAGSPTSGDVAAGGVNGGFAAGYAPSARYKGGMVTGGNSDGYIPATRETAVRPPAGIADPMIMDPMQKEAYEQALRQTFTMTPEMIAYYKSLMREQQSAMNARPDPKALVGSSYISLEPGENPTEIVLGTDLASTLSFYDRTGQAWPIDQYVHGSADAFQVIQLGKDANSIAVTPLTANAMSNMIIMLKGEPKPVMIKLGVSDVAVDYRRDITVSKAGPNAIVAPDIVTNPSSPIEREAGDRVLAAALDGADMPPAARVVKISGVNAQAWVLGDSLYIRTRSKLATPAPTNSMNGPDGLRVYQTTKAPVLTFYDNGVAIMASVDLP